VTAPEGGKAHGVRRVRAHLVPSTADAIVLSLGLLVGDFATAAQGVKADAALQPNTVTGLLAGNGTTTTGRTITGRRRDHRHQRLRRIREPHRSPSR
jgi:hypothetical protein